MDKKVFTVYMHVAPNMKKYIGITCRKPEKRWDSGDGYKTQNFYRAISKYGWNSFQHIIIAERLTKKEACKLEIDMIKYWNTANPKDGYNIYLGGELGRYGIPLTEENKEKIRQSNLGRTMSEENKKAVSRFHSGKILSEETKKKISISNSGKKRSKKMRKERSDIFKEIWEREGYKEKIYKSRINAILQFDKNMRFIKEWDCVQTASCFYNIESWGIYRCCSKIKEYFCGCIWIYKKDYDGEITPIFYSEEKLKQTVSKSVGISKKTRQKMRDAALGTVQTQQTIDKRIKKLMKPVLQFDKEMNFIREFEGAITAGDFLGIAKTSIGACCRGKLKTAGGFIWKFKD